MKYTACLIPSAAAAAIALAAGCGSSAGHQAAQHTTSPPAASSPAPPSGEAQFLAVAGGPPIQAVKHDLSRISVDLNATDLIDGQTDARHLARDTDALTAALEATSPPPRFATAKAHLFGAAYFLHRSGLLLADGLANRDVTEIQAATRLLVRGARQIRAATAALPPR